MSYEHSGDSEDRIFFLEKQEVVVDDFDAPGFSLDIGGGGEGVIGQLKGKQLVAMDPNRRELEEAANGPLKIFMDAGDLQFLDETFEVVTSFITLIYIGGSEHEQVFREAFRALEPGGRLLLWDVSLPRRLEAEKDIVAF